MITADKRPTDKEYAWLSQHVYNELNEGDVLSQNNHWKIYKTMTGSRGYFGVIYLNNKTNQIVLAHRGTDSFKAIIEDIAGIVNGKLSPQKEASFQLLEKAIELAKHPDYHGYHLSFTGHSLGGFLAELSVFYCHNSFGYPTVNAVTFESPGSRESLEKLQSHLQPIELNQLDIINYVAYPNLINTCNHHVGTLYSIGTDLGKYGWLSGWYTKQAHTIANIVKWFEGSANSQTNNDNTHSSQYCYMADWPKGSQMNIFFKYTVFEEGHYHLVKEEEEIIQENRSDLDQCIQSSKEQVKQLFDLHYRAHHNIDAPLSYPNALPLKHFSNSMQLFLKTFYASIYDISKNENLREELIQRWKALKIPEDISQFLLNYEILKNSRGIEILITTGPVITFRWRLSEWLAESGLCIFELLRLPQQTTLNSHLTEIMAAVVSPGSKVERTTVEDSDVAAFQIDLPPRASKEDVANLEELSQHILNKTRKITVYLFAPDSITTDSTFINVHGYGVRFKPSEEQTSIRTMKQKSPAQLVSDLSFRAENNSTVKDKTISSNTTHFNSNSTAQTQQQQPVLKRPY